MAEAIWVSAMMPPPSPTNSYALNKQAVDGIKRWHYSPTIVREKPVAVCSEIGVTIDLQ
jgi:hypothetical protein